MRRATLLDELNRPSAETARAKGGSGWRRLRYPVRVALNPIVGTVGRVLPAMSSGAAITAIVLGLPTGGPVLCQSLLNRDRFLAARIVLIGPAAADRQPGVLTRGAQNVRTVPDYPRQLAPGAVVIVTVLVFTYFGAGWATPSALIRERRNRSRGGTGTCREHRRRSASSAVG